MAPLGGTSFPSGHVLTYVPFYGFLGFLLAEHLGDGPLRNASVMTLTSVLALVGPSRIQQGHHWTTDVVASYLLGTRLPACAHPAVPRDDAANAPRAGDGPAPAGPMIARP